MIVLRCTDSGGEACVSENELLEVESTTDAFQVDVADEKLVGGCLDSTTHVDKLATKMAVPVLVEAGRTPLLIGYLVPLTDDIDCKLEVEIPS